MISWINRSKVIYILSNLFVLPATFIPYFDFISNISFIVSAIFLINKNVLLLLVSGFVFIIKNNSNYRFNILLKLKGEELSKSDYECVYLYAWCTLLRYFLIGLAAVQVF
tara:strand:+ start:1207 stop:1536 length:330 start_codon:yes stop_codon:yes gene_type:complete